MSMAYKCVAHTLDKCTDFPHVEGMTKSIPQTGIPQFQERALQALQNAGFADQSALALMALDLDHFRYVRRVMKGDIPQALMEELGVGLEHTQFHALSALVRIQCGQGRPAPQEPTVGLLAEELAVDPSRASRIAADLVERGYLSRAVSQEDGRRSVLHLTDQAMQMFDAFRAAKWQHTIRLFQSWAEKDILDFTRLFSAYVDGMGQEYPAKG